MKVMRKEEMIRLIQIGGIPPRLWKDALLICDDIPPRWRILKRRRFKRAFRRMVLWSGLENDRIVSPRDAP